MHDLLPEGEELRRAVKWVSDNLLENPDQSVQQLVHQAIFKYDLSPRDADFLINFHRKRSKIE
jgi:hypothetical protein